MSQGAKALSPLAVAAEVRPSPARDTFERLAWPTIAATLRLSARELEIIRCLITDDGEDAIAARLRISRHTVHSHLERVYRKVGVNSRLGLIVKVFATHLMAAQPDDDGPLGLARVTPRSRGPADDARQRR